MHYRKALFRITVTVIILLFFSGCRVDPTRFYPETKTDLKREKSDFKFVHIGGVSRSKNIRIKNFIKDTVKKNGEKIVVFSADGTLLPVIPCSVAEQAMQEYSEKHPNWKPDLTEKMEKQDRNSIEYINNGAIFWSGLRAKEVEQIGYNTFIKHYQFYSQIYDLIGNLKNNNYEIWVVTSAPEILYQKFISEYLNIPKNRVLGAKTVINKEGILTDKLIRPYMGLKGKCNAVKTFIKHDPLLVAGSNAEDAELINLAEAIKIAVNPDSKNPIELFNNVTLEVYAVKHQWIILDFFYKPDENLSGTDKGKLDPNAPIEIY
ncbi:MAG: hypothetical protein K9L78_01260 [Victivallales bacterium]|nr:hypothetical protein [Victivallales bacterium]MCF7888725.1 hypothetical protein [Victivallales bacterium]